MAIIYLIPLSNNYHDYNNKTPDKFLIMYFPKSQITPNLYTNGGEYVLLTTQKDYKGYYFKTSSGKYYTGRNSNDLPNLEIVAANSLFSDIKEPPGVSIYTIVTELDGPLEVTSSEYNTSNIDVEYYLNIKNINAADQYTTIPYYAPTYPTTQDYQVGEFRRFFCKKTNEIQYIEIDPKQYSLISYKDPKILWQLYFPFNIPWNISGQSEDVARVNKNIVELTMKQLKLPRFNDYLKNDYLKHFI
jgi:hypothetical protein